MGCGAHNTPYPRHSGRVYRVDVGRGCILGIGGGTGIRAADWTEQHNTCGGGGGCNRKLHLWRINNKSPARSQVLRMWADALNITVLKGTAGTATEVSDSDGDETSIGLSDQPIHVGGARGGALGQ